MPNILAQHSNHFKVPKLDKQQSQALNLSTSAQVKDYVNSFFLKKRPNTQYGTPAPHTQFFLLRDT